MPNSNPADEPSSLAAVRSEPCLDGANLPQSLALFFAKYLTGGVGERLTDTCPVLTRTVPRCINIALSGGADSMAVTHALWRLRQDPDSVLSAIPLRVLHVHHGLHAQADIWQNQVVSFCQQLGLPLKVLTVSVVSAGQGVEAAARQARYRALMAELAAGDFLVTGHHQDDQAETVLLNLLRGAGLRGLAGMAECRRLGDAYLVRPVLTWPTTELQRYCVDHRLTWVDDPSNRDNALRRNFLRHQVLPLLRQHWPQASIQLARSAQLLRSYETRWESEETLWLSAYGQAPQAMSPALVLDGWCRVESCPQRIPLAMLQEQTRLGQRRIIQAWLRQWDTPPIPAKRLDSLLIQLERSSSERAPQLDWCDWSLRRFHGHLYLLGPEFLCSANPGQVQWLQPQLSSLHHPWFGLLEITPSIDSPLQIEPEQEPRLAQLESAFTLSLRWREGGERILSADGKHQRVKTILQESALPPWIRGRVPLLYRHETLWAVGSLRLHPEFQRLLQQRGQRLHWYSPPLLAQYASTENENENSAS